METFLTEKFRQEKSISIKPAYLQVATVSSTKNSTSEPIRAKNSTSEPIRLKNYSSEPIKLHERYHNNNKYIYTTTSSKGES